MTLKYETWYKIEKENQKKIEKNIFFGGKKNSKKIGIFFFGKMKKSEKNNAGKWAIFFYQKPEIGKTKKSKFSDIFVPFVCTLKIFCETTLWCYVVFQKFFRDVWTSFRYLKNSPKSFFSEKKAIVLFFRGKKKNSKKNFI